MACTVHVVIYLEEWQLNSDVVSLVWLVSVCNGVTRSIYVPEARWIYLVRAMISGLNHGRWGVTDLRVMGFTCSWLTFRHRSFGTHTALY